MPQGHHVLRHLLISDTMHAERVVFCHEIHLAKKSILGQNGDIHHEEIALKYKHVSNIARMHMY